MTLLSELQRRGYMLQEDGLWFDLCTPQGAATIRVEIDDTDIIIRMLDRDMVELWNVRLSNPPDEVITGALNIAQGALALAGRADEARPKTGGRRHT